MVNETGVFLPNILISTSTFSPLISEIVASNDENGPSITLTTSPMMYFNFLDSIWSFKESSFKILLIFAEFP